MTEFNEIEPTEERKSRPGFLTVICVLSYIALGFGVLGGMLNLSNGPSSDAELKTISVEYAKMKSDLKSQGMNDWTQMIDQIEAMSYEMNDQFYLAGIINLLIVAIGIYAVRKMWTGAKLGFHAYIIYCLLSVCALYIYVSPANIPTFMILWNVFFSGLFVLFYGLNLKWMK